jgi:predicted type IV restriction endonuclease
MEMRVTLKEAIQQVLQNAAPPPSTEAATLFRIIDPLLLAMGYSPHGN